MAALEAEADEDEMGPVFEGWDRDAADNVDREQVVLQRFKKIVKK